MKKLFYIFGISGILFTACVSNPEGDKAETTEATEVAEGEGKELDINTSNSKITWTGKKITATHHGEIRLKSGSVFVNGEEITAGMFIIDMNTLNDLDLEGDSKEKLEGHLKSEDFFDVAKFPEAKLEITQVLGYGVGRHKASANLTIKDVTKNIAFIIDIKEITTNSLIANADFNIKRADWGIVYPGKPDDLISEEINFKIDIDAKE